MDYLLLSTVGLGFVIVACVIWLSRRRPDSRVRQLIARADWQLEAEDFDSARELLKAAEEPFALVQDEAERRELRSELDRRLGGLALNEDDYGRAEQLLSSAVENCDTLLSSRDPSSVQPLGNLAIAQFEQGNDLHADAGFERILRFEPNEYAPDLAQTSELLRQLAMACLARDFYRWPERLLLRSLEHLNEHCDPDGDRRVRTALNLAQARFILMDYRGTRQALAQASDWANDESGYMTFSFLRGYLALLACDWENAEEQLQQNHLMASNALGERSSDAADALGALADLQRVQGRFAEAGSLSNDALSIVEECLGDDHPQLAYHLLRHGMICIQHGDLSAADRHLTRGLQLTRSRPRRANSLIGTLHLVSGILDLERGRLDSAAQSLLEARQVSEAVCGRGHRMTMDSIMILAEVRLQQGKLGQAVALAEEAVTVRERQDDVAVLDQIDLLKMLARIRIAQDDLASAEQALTEIGQLIDRHLAEDHYERAEVLHERGRLRRQEGRLPEAEQLLRDSLNLQERLRLPLHPMIARLLEDQVQVLMESGKDSVAADLRSRAESIRTTLNLVRTDPDV